jgi:hypothetical protein
MFSIQILGRLMRTIILLLSLIPLCAWALDPWGEMIPVHGRYSKLYESDWSKLGTAKENWDRSPSDYTWTDGLSGVSRSYSGSVCQIKNIARKVGISDVAGNKVLFNFNGCDKTIIENVAIWFTDKWSFTHAFVFNHSGDVYIKNLYIRGAVQKTHITLWGGRYVYMNNIEFEGIDYTGDGKEENARGIYLHGGECVSEGSCSVGPYTPFKFFVLQNIYSHDFDGDIIKGFPETIGITSGGDGIVFNCFSEHWTAGEGIIMEIVHRRSDKAYGQGHVMRVERCIVNDGRYIKQGAAPAKNDTMDNHTIWANNIFINTAIAADFKQEDDYFINNTWLMNAERVFRIWNQRRMIHFYNNLVYYDCTNCPNQFFEKTPNRDTDDKRRFWDIDYNLYYGITPTRIWQDDMNSSRNLTWSSWQNSGKDKHSKIIKSGNLFANYNANKYQYTLASSSLVRRAGNPKYVVHSRAGLRVDKDFFGKTRSSQTPDIGAIEYASSSSDERLPTPKNVKISRIK